MISLTRPDDLDNTQNNTNNNTQNNTNTIQEVSRSKSIILRNTGLGLDVSEMTDMGSESLFPQEPVPVALTMYIVHA